MITVDVRIETFTPWNSPSNVAAMFAKGVEFVNSVELVESLPRDFNRNYPHILRATFDLNTLDDVKIALHRNRCGVEGLSVRDNDITSQERGQVCGSQRRVGISRGHRRLLLSNRLHNKLFNVVLRCPVVLTLLFRTPTNQL